MSRLEKFNLESLAGMTQTDEMELWSLGEKKTAIFAVIPDNDSSFNFIVGLLYYVTAEQLDAAAKEVERQKALAAERRRSRKQHERQER